mmetsp:Transcript_19348/g.41614  ORF Transcript_19348/g.41614 Transcript_19348/m.41614 type:complete len:277 (-) Transcript_19348:70-900(-)
MESGLHMYPRSVSTSSSEEPGGISPVRSCTVTSFMAAAGSALSTSVVNSEACQSWTGRRQPVRRSRESMSMVALISAGEEQVTMPREPGTTAAGAPEEKRGEMWCRDMLARAESSRSAGVAPDCTHCFTFCVRTAADSGAAAAFRVEARRREEKPVAIFDTRGLEKHSANAASTSSSGGSCSERGPSPLALAALATLAVSATVDASLGFIAGLRSQWTSWKTVALNMSYESHSRRREKVRGPRAISSSSSIVRRVECARFASTSSPSRTGKLLRQS